ncbi:hypothetical protein PVK06_008307 [Gossypium arboreum]|uniref:Uncharacterized protein n=1 Tax=Gossypium arboreum TaxID=29729 RepID=A0ABR0QKH1_GOSAR|nr:hypothetical protein PVK06_008307 [Gossypium arboreum]
MVDPIPIRKKINALKWERFCDARSFPDNELVREFYASLTMQDVTEVIVRKKKVPLTSKSINDLFNLPNVEEDEYYPMMNNINCNFLQQVFDVVTNPGSQWIIRKYGSYSCRREYLKQVAKEDPTEPDTEDSTDGTETEANLVTDTEEEESHKEPNTSKPIEGPKNPEPRVEPEKEPVKLSVEPQPTTPMPTSSSASRKSELSILMDMCEFIYNQQQTY